MLSSPPLYFTYANRYRTSFEGMGWEAEEGVEAGEEGWGGEAEPAVEELTLLGEGEGAGEGAGEEAEGEVEPLFAEELAEAASFCEEALEEEAWPQPARTARREREAARAPAAFRALPSFMLPPFTEVKQNIAND